MIIIPGELISLIVFPGVILHEFSHKLFCDITNVPVYRVSYFELTSKSAGHVIHGGARNLIAGLLIALGPLIINTLLCMLLTIPYGCAFYLGTDFALPYTFGYNFLAWLGFSIGFSAIPSETDVKDLDKLAKWEISKIAIYILQGIIFLFNMPYIGFFLHGAYALAISQIIPKFLC